MIKSKYAVTFVVVPSIFVIHLVKGAYFLNATGMTEDAVTVISPFTKMKVSL